MTGLAGRDKIDEQAALGARGGEAVRRLEPNGGCVERECGFCSGSAGHWSDSLYLVQSPQGLLALNYRVNQAYVSCGAAGITHEVFAIGAS